MHICSKAAVSGALLLSFLATGPAFANRQSDYFNTGNASRAVVKPKQGVIPNPEMGRQGAGAMGSDRTPIVIWFESYDDLRATLRPTAEDRTILTRDFNKDVERVKQFILTANNVSKNYRMLANKLRTLPVPPGASKVSKYRNLQADWCEDMAAIYEDMIRPRPAARTIEELNDELQVIKQRAEILCNTSKNLQAMDLDLRREFRVHQDKHADALWQYVSGKPK
ncbi:MAG TPA: hypothetical protein V6D17_20580 [Candidatus Obscuribacterales bacterium]